MLVDVGSIIDLANDFESESAIRRSLATLADDLNANLPEYRVALIHLDTKDLLEFRLKKEREANVQQPE